MKRALLTYLVWVVVQTAGPVYATTIDPMLWQEMAIGCDFVGIVECTTAGGIVAEYKVVDAWKGPQHDEAIRIQVAVNYWEPQFPIALVGDQYLVFAYSNRVPSSIASTTLGGPVPLWWRQVEHDYNLPLFQGRYELDANQMIAAYDFEYRYDGQKTIAVSEIKTKARQLLSKSKAQQEVTLLKLLFNKYFVQRNKSGLESTLSSLDSYKNPTTDEHREYVQYLKTEAGKYEQQIAQVEPIAKKFENTTDPIELIDLIFDLSISDYETYRNGLRTVLRKAVLTAECLEHLKERIAGTDAALLDDYVRTYIPEQIQARISPIERVQAAPPVTITYTDGELKEHRSTLTDYRNRESQWSRSFEILVEQDPVWAARWLKGWQNPHKKWQDEHMGYNLGSWLAYHCKQDREKCLDILLGAKETYVRVAAAVYLCFEDEERGTKQLRKMRKYKDTPGLWATLNLARRGDKEAVGTLVQAFPEMATQEGAMVNVPGRNLMKRTLVLLSNSADYSQLPQPPHDLFAAEAIDAWWNKYKEQITLYDPWMEQFKTQKVD